MLLDEGHPAAVEVTPNRMWREETGLPPRLRLLCVGPTEPSWVSLTLQLDAEGCLEPQFRWVSTSSSTLATLRDESFDCILVCVDSKEAEADSQTAPLSLLRAIRASGYDDPVILIATHLDDERWTQLCQKDCEVLITPNLWESLALVPVIKRAISRVELSREKHRLEIANHRRLVRERDEAEHLLRQQRQIIQELETLTAPAVERGGRGEAAATSEETARLGADHVSFPLPAEINDYYHELLRTYVIMGCGSLGPEIAKLAELISLAGLSPREGLELHLERVEALVRGLGNRSARHVMARADLLALELMMHLGECYQRKSLTA